jgi:hypothetical protein
VSMLPYPITAIATPSYMFSSVSTVSVTNCIRGDREVSAQFSSETSSILTEALHGFIQAIQANSGTVPSTKLPTLPSTLFPTHYSLTSSHSSVQSD